MTKRFRCGSIAGCLTVLAAFSASAQEDTYQTIYAGANIHLPVETYHARQFARVIKQQTDFSCGSAALATLLTYHYGIERSEDDVFRSMWEAGEQDAIRKRGFSLLDMKRYLAARDLLADGYSLSLDKLEEIGVPAIALVTINGYKHFVVIKGIRGERILLGDPSAGLVVRSRKEFEASWDGTIFFIRSYVDRGKQGWNTEIDWAAHPRGDVRSRPEFPTLQDTTLHTAYPVDSAFGISGIF